MITHENIKTQKKKREYVELKNKEDLWLFTKIIQANRICCVCKKTITKSNIGALFNNPTRILCDSIICKMEFLDENDYM